LAIETRGGGGEGGKGTGKYRTPQANFRTLININAIKPEIGGPSQAIFPESLDPPRDLDRHFPWIFNPCATM
jgi:hypothetical protein